MSKPEAFETPYVRLNVDEDGDVEVAAGHRSERRPYKGGIEFITGDERYELAEWCKGYLRWLEEGEP